MLRTGLGVAAALMLLRRGASADRAPTFQPSTDAPDPRYGLALDEAHRKIDYQVRTVEALRTRSVALAGFIAVTATFFVTIAGRVTADDKITWTLWLAVGLASLGLGVALCVTVLWPRDFRFTVSATTVIAEIEAGMDPHSAARWLATSEHENSLTNDDNIRLMTRCLAVALALYGIGVIALLVDLLGRG